MTELNNTQLLKPFKILVVGDSCVDTYYYGTVDRISPEAPVPIFKPTRQEEKAGMGANVARNLQAFNCNVMFVYDELNVCNKKRFICERSKQHLLRVDSDSTARAISIEGDLKEFDAVVISDYNKGAITDELILDLQERFKRPIFLDTKKTDLAKFNKCIVKINALEYSKLTSKCDKLIVTRGGEGAEYNGKLWKTPAVEVVDVCGAGDTFLAALCWAYLSSDNLNLAINFANACASIAVQHTGAYVLNENDFKSLIIPPV
jgi:D-beta-D-heptose 7-phosphate kinase/D-beta-D-heptose 1-phosphate adenosyltransferase